MFPHPFQMALMGYWLSENRHQDLAEYVSRVEAYARTLEQRLEAALRQRDQWQEYGRELESRVNALAQEYEKFRQNTEAREEAWKRLQKKMEEEQQSTVNKLRDVDTAMNQLLEKHRTLVRDAAKLKAFLQDFFGTHATRLLTPLGLKHCEKVLRFIQRLPDDPRDGPGL